MNVDEAMAIADNYRIWLSGGRVEMNSSEIVAITLAAEVERLRAELAAAKANSEALKKALYSLQEAAIRLGDRLDDAKTELVVVKVASACPVKVLNIWEGTYESDRYLELRTDAEADTFTDWLRERMKDKSPPEA